MGAASAAPLLLWWWVGGGGWQVFGDVASAPSPHQCARCWRGSVSWGRGLASLTRSRPPAPAHGPAGAMFVKGGLLPPHGQRQPRPARGPARCSLCPVGRASRGAWAGHGALPHTPRPPLTRPAPVSWPAPPAASLRGLQRQPVGQHGFYRVGPRGCGGAGPCVYLGQ